MVCPQITGDSGNLGRLLHVSSRVQYLLPSEILGLGEQTSNIRRHVTSTTLHRGLLIVCDGGECSRNRYVSKSSEVYRVFLIAQQWSIAGWISLLMPDISSAGNAHSTQDATVRSLHTG